MSQLTEFVDKARTKGWNDDRIRHELTVAGWDQAAVNDALNALVVPKPGDEVLVPISQPKTTTKGEHPIAVVHNLSVLGFEYSIMFISMIGSAFSLAALLLTYLSDLFSSGSTYDDGSGSTAFFVTLMIVVFPIFVGLFIRLKKAELNNPSIRLDPSRRRWIQFTQLIAFLFGIGFIVSFIYRLLVPSYGSYDTNPHLGEQLLRTVIVLGIAGSIFLYYWFDEHRTEQK